MAEAALAIVPTQVRRFDTADLSQHGKWVMPRMLQAFPHLNERGAASFLQSIIYNNEYCIMFADCAIGLAQVMSAHNLDASPIIHERFVWCADPQDKAQQKVAAEFYTEFAKWGKRMNVEAMIVGENTDVPHEMIKEKLGRIFNRQQQFARL